MAYSKHIDLTGTNIVELLDFISNFLEPVVGVQGEAVASSPMGLGSVIFRWLPVIDVGVSLLHDITDAPHDAVIWFHRYKSAHLGNSNHLIPSSTLNCVDIPLILLYKGIVPTNPGERNMKLSYTENPYPAINLIDGEYGFTMKSLGVSGEGMANKIADAVAFGKFKLDDLMDVKMATAADVITKYNL